LPLKVSTSGGIMGKEIIKKEVMAEIFKATPHLLKFPTTKM